MQVWDGISDARINFDTTELATASRYEGMARLTENLNLQRGLLHLLDKVPGLDLIHRTKVTSITRESEAHGAWPIVNLDNGRRLRARLLVSCFTESPLDSLPFFPSRRWVRMDSTPQSEPMPKSPPLAGHTTPKASLLHSCITHGVHTKAQTPLPTSVSSLPAQLLSFHCPQPSLLLSGQQDPISPKPCKPVTAPFSHA